MSQLSDDNKWSAVPKHGFTLFSNCKQGSSLERTMSYIIFCSSICTSVWLFLRLYIHLSILLSYLLAWELWPGGLSAKAQHLQNYRSLPKQHFTPQPPPMPNQSPIPTPIPYSAPPIPTLFPSSRTHFGPPPFISCAFGDVASRKSKSLCAYDM